MSKQEIRLPEWYACFSVGGTPTPPRGSASSRIQIGPITVFKPEAGVSVATFGPPQTPSVMLFDGYLFERQALRGELGLAADAGDAEIAAAAFARWRDDVFDRLEGSYLLAIWDASTHRLLLGHDALGHHPVFYAPAQNGFWFGSNVLALAKCGQFETGANRVSLALAAMTQWPAAGHTFFNGIFRMDAGQYLTVTRDYARRAVHYFSPGLGDDEPYLSKEDVAEQFEPTLAAAVRRCMELGPEGIMFSGGLDSVTIGALAASHARAHGRPAIVAVSGQRDSAPTGEEPMQAAASAALGMPHLAAKESSWKHGRGDIELSLEIVGDLPGPSRIYWVGSYMAFYRHTAAQGVRVLLTGSGGDNWVAVGNAYAAESLRRLRLGNLYRFMYSYTATGGMSWKNAAHYFLWSGGIRMFVDAFGARWMPRAKARYHRTRAEESLPAWLCPDRAVRQALVETLLSQRPAALSPDGRMPKDFYRHEQRAVVNPHQVHEFEVAFHVDAVCGLRLLHPYHDRQVVRFLRSVPPEVLLDGARYKGLLRTVAERHLPRLGLKDQRKDYAPAVIAAHHQELHDGIRKAWSETALTRLEQLGVLNFARTREALVPGAVSSKAHVQMHALMSAERWLASHGL